MNDEIIRSEQSKLHDMRLDVLRAVSPVELQRIQVRATICRAQYQLWALQQLPKNDEPSLWFTVGGIAWWGLAIGSGLLLFETFRARK